MFLTEHYLTPWQAVLPENITLQLICEPNLIVDTYPELLLLILNNLTENSMLHGFKEGQLGYVDVSVISRLGGFGINFQDSGSGIPIKEAKGIFEPFYSAENNFIGTGLGLYAVYNAVVQIFQGEIKYLGDSNKGVTYQIYIPNLKLGNN